MGLLESALAGMLNRGGNGSPVESILMSLLANQGLQGGQGGNAQAGNPIAGLISRFEQAGLGSVAQSWVGNGANQPVSPEQLHGALGEEQVQALSSQTGMAPHDLLSQLAQALPGIIDRLTPNGRVPAAEELAPAQA